MGVSWRRTTIRTSSKIGVLLFWCPDYRSDKCTGDAVFVIWIVQGISCGPDVVELPSLDWTRNPEQGFGLSLDYMFVSLPFGRALL